MRGFNPVVETTDYFLRQGLAMGAEVGVLCGTLMLPMAGTVAGLIIGLITGVVAGLIVGIGVNLANRVLLHDETDLTTYRRTLTRWSGRASLWLMNGGVLLLFIAGAANNTPGIFALRRLTIESFGGRLLAFLPLYPVLLVAFIGPVAAFIAYSASQYADQIIAPSLAKLNTDATPLPLNPGAMGHFMRLIRRNTGWLIPAGTLAVCVLHYLVWSPPRPGQVIQLRDLSGGVIGGAILVSLVILMLGLFNSIVLTLVNRLYFDEYARHLTLKQYQCRLMYVLGGLTLVYSVVVTVLFFAPLAAFIAVLSAREYAVWHYGDAEKRKHQSG